MRDHLLALVSSSAPILPYPSLIVHTVIFPSLVPGLSSGSTGPVLHRKLVLVVVHFLHTSRIDTWIQPVLNRHKQGQLVRGGTVQEQTAHLTTICLPDPPLLSVCTV